MITKCSDNRHKFEHGGKFEWLQILSHTHWGLIINHYTCINLKTITCMHLCKKLRHMTIWTSWRSEIQPSSSANVYRVSISFQPSYVTAALSFLCLPSLCLVLPPSSEHFLSIHFHVTSQHSSVIYTVNCLCHASPSETYLEINGPLKHFSFEFYIQT